MAEIKYHPALKFIKNDELANSIKNKSILVGKDIAIIDVRDNDFQGGNITNCLNYPSKQFDNRKEELLNKVKNYPKVAFLCGSSTGRGPRIGGYYKEFFDLKKDEPEFNGNLNQEVLVLEGGFKAWWPKFKDDPALVENFDSKIWEIKQ